jgi:hypothetical protein
MNWSFVERSSVHEETRNDQDADRKEYLRLQKAREEAGDPPPPVVQLREWDAEAAAARAQQLVEELSQPPYRYASVCVIPDWRCFGACCTLSLHSRGGLSCC